MYYNEFTFYDCGLDIECNILEAPVCPCGCGSKGHIVADDEMSIYDFVHSVLDETDCGYCAIFIIHQNSQIVCAAKVGDEHTTYVYNPDCEPLTLREAMDGVKEFQDNFKFHCYGLLVQVEDEDEYVYKVIED